jgi:hypothetical protein
LLTTSLYTATLNILIIRTIIKKTTKRPREFTTVYKKDHRLGSLLDSSFNGSLGVVTTDLSELLGLFNLNIRKKCMSPKERATPETVWRICNLTAISKCIFI